MKFDNVVELCIIEQYYDWFTSNYKYLVFKNGKILRMSYEEIKEKTVKSPLLNVLVGENMWNQ
jgi:hypothetical protein